MQLDDCKSECGGSTNNGCDNPDQHEPWIKSSCGINCASSNLKNVSTNTSGFSTIASYVLEILAIHITSCADAKVWSLKFHYWSVVIRGPKELDKNWWVC